MPLLLGAVLLALFWWLRGEDLSSTARQRVHLNFILASTMDHLVLTVVSTVLVLLIAIPLGVILTRSFARRITPATIAVFNVGQGIPSIGLLALFALAWAIGFWPVVVGLVVYTVLPVLRNTMVGLQQVDTSVIESARGMGMTKFGVLARIELPLAVPVMMAGVRTALVINVGTATLGTFFAAGGLGDIINTGITRSDELITVTGSVLVAVLALLIDYLGGIAEDLLRPRGM
ncbi:MAG: ABC transporter permease [Intrasporangium sp.]|uniref:ABC transporter permease n=1 Tax=Intrasporangium sp. TaxID=1925024 RepID=UPI002647616C|nr:ABC transporter permease [Intrasporangium sp.]MDN5794419.1 ABC transporter permease [Intrasporangium sp.]